MTASGTPASISSSKNSPAARPWIFPIWSPTPALTSAPAKTPASNASPPAWTKPYAAAAAASVTTCLEITAGQGSSLGYRLEHLAEIISQSKTPDKLAVCLDTAHLFAAGYDFRGRRYAAFRRDLDKTVGLKRVKVLHLNDSKKDLGSRVDRHDHIGLGKIGREGFIPIVRDEAFANVPKILETPKIKHPSGRLWDEVNLLTLRSMAK